MTEESPKFMMKEENEGLSSALLRHGVTMEEEGIVTIIASVDQEARIAGMRFGIRGEKCSGLFKADSLWKTAASNLMCKVEVDLEDFEFPRSGSQPRNLSLWRDGSEIQLSFFCLDNNNEATYLGEDDVMEVMGETSAVVSMKYYVCTHAYALYMFVCPSTVALWPLTIHVIHV